MFWGLGIRSSLLVLGIQVLCDLGPAAVHTAATSLNWFLGSGLDWFPNVIKLETWTEARTPWVCGCWKRSQTWAGWKLRKAPQHAMSVAPSSCCQSQAGLQQHVLLSLPQMALTMKRRDHLLSTLWDLLCLPCCLLFWLHYWLSYNQILINQHPLFLPEYGFSTSVSKPFTTGWHCFTIFLWQTKAKG